MNSYERVMRRLRGEPVDKIPNLNIIMAFGAKHVGATYAQFASDYHCLVEANLKCCEDFGIDAVSAISDPTREAHAFGANVVIPKQEAPYCAEPLIKDYDQLSKLKPLSPYDDIRTLDRIKAVEEYAKHVKHKVPIIGWVEGVLAEAADLREISQLMMDLILEPEAVNELMEIIYEYQLSFAKAQVEAGADIIGIGDAAASLVGPALYEEFALPYEKKLVREIHAMGAKTKLHICGNIEPLLEQLVEVESDIVDVDWMVNFEKAVHILGSGKSSACGNADPVSVILQGSEEKVIQTVSHCIEVSDAKTIIAAGCEIPRDTPYANLLTMNRLLKI